MRNYLLNVRSQKYIEEKDIEISKRLEKKRLKHNLRKLLSHLRWRKSNNQIDK